MKRIKHDYLCCSCHGRPIEHINRRDRHGNIRTYDLCPVDHESLGVGLGVRRSDYLGRIARKRQAVSE